MNNDEKLEKLKLIWDEYKYRHQHCWKLIFQTTAAVVAVSVIPYINTSTDLVKKLGYLMVALPALGFALTVFSMFRMHKELGLLDTIREKYRELQKDLLDITHKEGRTTFKRDVMIYMGVLAALNIANMYVLKSQWISPK